MQYFFKCEHRNEKLDINVHIYFINSEKKSFKMSFQRIIQNGIFFQYPLYDTETWSSPQCLATHAADWSVDKSEQMASMQMYADVTKTSGLYLINVILVINS